MVGVSIAAARLEGHYHRGLELADELHDLSKCLVTRDVDKGALVFVVGGAVHSRVSIVEEPKVFYAEHGGRCAHLAFSDSAEVLGGGQCRVRDLTDLPACRANQPGFDTVACGL